MRAFAASALAVSACQNLASPTARFDRQVNYGDAKADELVTNEFGSTDLQMIAEKMTGGLLETGIFQGRPAALAAFPAHAKRERGGRRAATQGELHFSAAPHSFPGAGPRRRWWVPRS